MSHDYSTDVFAAWLTTPSMRSQTLLQVFSDFSDPALFHQSFMQGKEDAVSMIPERFRSGLRKTGQDTELRKLEAALRQNHIRICTINDPAYPVSLTNITEPPGVLFYQGDFSLVNRKALAIVGSRTASYTGQKATKQISQALSDKGVVIISGLANGIDTAAHEGCLEGKSPTMAVLGSGLCRVYPQNNTTLRDAILEKGGLTLSEYAPYEAPLGWHFPVRNRILIGLAQALVFMEGKIRSGSMTTVQHALDQGKDVFVFPGDPLSPYFEGNHQLLREGAIFFTRADEILDDLGWLDNPSIIGQNIDCSPAVDPVSSIEMAVINALKPGSRSFEQLIQLTQLDPSALMTALTMLQINGIIIPLPGKSYELKA